MTQQPPASLAPAKGKGSQRDAQKVLGYCTANAPLGSTAALVVVVVGSDDEHDDSRELVRLGSQAGKEGFQS